MLLVETPWTSHAHPPVSQSTASDCEEKGSRRFQIFDVVDVATGEVRRDGGHLVEVLKVQGLQGMRPLFVVRRLAETKEVRVRTFAAFTRIFS